MSAHRYTDCRVDCDHEGCGRSEFGGNLSLMEPTAAETRRVLKRRGWLVDVPAHPADDRRRLDFCPAHKTQGAREEAARAAGEKEQ